MLKLGRVTKVKVLFLVLVFVFNFDLFKFSAAILEKGLLLTQIQQEAISQKEIVFRFRKDIQSEKGWGFDILCMRSPGVKG